MSHFEEASSSGSHHPQQPLRSRQHRKPYQPSELARQDLQNLYDGIDDTNSITTPPESYLSTADPPEHILERDFPHSLTQAKPLTNPSSDSRTTRSATSPPREKTSTDNLSISDIALVAIALSPALLHLWARCFAQSSTPRQLGTWFALLSLPVSAPLFRWERMPHRARDVLEILSYGSALTVSIDCAVVGYYYLMEYPPASEWEWLVYCPAVIAAGMCWVVVVGFLWAFVMA